jgi:hypothetical protein
MQIKLGSGIAQFAALAIAAAALGFSTEATAQNHAPVISGTPPSTATVGTLYSWTPTVSDPDRNTLTLTLNGKPAWASFDAKTGRLYGTPTAVYAATTSTSRLNVSDGAASTSLRFSITVRTASSGGSIGGTSGSPMITGTPPSTATVGVFYSWKPIVSDPNNDAVALTLNGKPAWAAFDPRTGQVFGTPTATYAGTMTTSKLNASDGTNTTTLRFSITVGTSASASSTGVAAVTLNWTPPTTNTDGSALTNLSGYRIMYGPAPGQYTKSLNVSVGLSRYTIDSLSPGKYYFAIAAKNSAGIESEPSPEVSASL